MISCFKVGNEAINIDEKCESPIWWAEKLIHSGCLITKSDNVLSEKVLALHTFDNQTLFFYLAIRQQSKDLKHLILDHSEYRVSIHCKKGLSLNINVNNKSYYFFDEKTHEASVGHPWFLFSVFFVHNLDYLIWKKVVSFYLQRTLASCYAENNDNKVT